MQARREEILAKKAKLAELKRQRELRISQGATGRTSIGAPGDYGSSAQSRADRSREIEALIDSLVGEAKPSSAPRGSTGSPDYKSSRPNSVLSAGDLSNEVSEPVSSQTLVQTLSSAPPITVYDCPPSPVKETFSYSKGVQTTESWTSPMKPRQAAAIDAATLDDALSTPSKRSSRKDREREEELRQNIRKEIEEELRAAKELIADGPILSKDSTSGLANRTFSNEELNAVVASDDFLHFFERSTKVIEKALDQYDILTDYTLHASDTKEEDDQGVNTGGKGRRKVKEFRQFYDERWSKKRMISAIDFSPKFQELLLASYTKNPSAPHDPDGIVQVWNLNLHDRPEFVFHAQSDILTAQFSPFHPNLIIGGTYSGQVLLWDTRARSAPVQKTPLSGYGHTHPIYALDIIGTQNANNIISTSTDGTVCVWTVDMLSQPQEPPLTLVAPSGPHGPHKTDSISPLSMAFPQADPTSFLVGTEEGTIYPCHRYDRAGAKAGADQKMSYKGHTAPVTSLHYHPGRGPVDLSDLVLSSSLDWSVKLWKVRAPATTTTASTVGGAGGSTAEEGVFPYLMEIVREDIVYDAAWSPVQPGVFALVDGAGWVEVWDLTVETEEPVARISPTPSKHGRPMMNKSLNRVRWEPQEGNRFAAGGLDGVLTVFEVGPDLGGRENVKAESWTSVKRLVNNLEAAGANGATDA